MAARGRNGFGDGIGYGAIFVLELVTDRGFSPSTLSVVALVVETCSVNVDEGLKRRVDGAKGRVLGRNAAIQVGRFQIVFEAGEVLRPLLPSLDGQIETCQRIVLTGSPTKVR